MRNISIRKYSTLKNDITHNALLSSLKPKNLFAGKQSNIDSLPYLDVVYWYDHIKKINAFNDVCELFIFIFGIDSEAFWNEKVTSFYEAQNFILEDFKRRQETEAKLLSSGVNNNNWTAAGGDSLIPFSKVTPLDDIAQRYGGYPFDYGRKAYSEIIFLLTMITKKNKVQRAYEKIVNS
jgi:hypothetical protein